MPKNKKLKIRLSSSSNPSKKLILKKDPIRNSSGTKANPPPKLNETPDVDAPSVHPPHAKKLHIKSKIGNANEQLTQKNHTPKSSQTSKGLTIKSKIDDTNHQPTQKNHTPKSSQPSKGLTIKSKIDDTNHQPTQKTHRPKSNQASKGLTIKTAQQHVEQSDNGTASPKGLTIKVAPQSSTEAIEPVKNDSESMADSPSQAPKTSTATPIMLSNYKPQASQQVSTRIQGPIFPTTNSKLAKPQEPPTPDQDKLNINSSGPIFPTANQLPDHSAAKAPETMPPPTHKTKALVSLSGIMGEVKTAKKIFFEETKQPTSIQHKPKLLKTKKTANNLQDSLGNDFCLIPPGTYYIGSENQLEEIKSPFTLAKYPVTKKQYFEFITENNIPYSQQELNQINKTSPHSNCPAVMVSWTDAKNYCRWLRKKTGEYYALPSIREWEVAARSMDGRVYPWGDKEPDSSIACFNDGYMEPQSTCSVDYFLDNCSPYGCIGMIGNVMEWTLDSFEDERKPHILKGGSWMSTIGFCNSVTPCMSFPEDKRKDFFGFRLLYLPKELYPDYKETLRYQ